MLAELKYLECETNSSVTQTCYLYLNTGLSLLCVTITYCISIPYGDWLQIQAERDELYQKFVKAIHEVQQKSNFKNLLLEKKLGALADTLEKKEAQLNEVLSASNLDPTALTVVTRKLEVHDYLSGFFRESTCIF